MRHGCATGVILALVAACREGDSSGDMHTATMLATGDVGTSPVWDDAMVPIEVRFVGTFGDEPAGCDVSYRDVGVGHHTVQLVDARFYVSNVRLVDVHGEDVPVTLIDDDAWQNETTVLIDFEDGTGHCSAANTAETYDRVLGMAPAGTYTKLRFDVGVPHEQNHIDSMLADPPLNETAMFWSWRNGFKFMRIDLAVETGDNPTEWAFHLGSTGFPCTGDAGSVTRPAEDVCARPSRPSIELPFDATSTTVKVDFAALFATSDLGAPADPPAMNPPGCQSFDFDAPDDACRGPFAALGLDVATGHCEADCHGQTVFSIAHP